MHDSAERLNKGEKVQDMHAEATQAYLEAKEEVQKLQRTLSKIQQWEETFTSYELKKPQGHLLEDPDIKKFLERKTENQEMKNLVKDYQPFLSDDEVDGAIYDIIGKHAQEARNELKDLQEGRMTAGIPEVPRYKVKRSSA